MKLWDVAEGRDACVATWRMPQQVLRVLDGLHLPGCATVMMRDSVQVHVWSRTTQPVSAQAWLHLYMYLSAVHVPQCSTTQLQPKHISSLRERLLSSWQHMSPVQTLHGVPLPLLC